VTIAPGTRLGQYEITAKLSAGGMGAVWRAIDTNLGRDVTDKALPAELARGCERLARVEREGGRDEAEGAGKAEAQRRLPMQYRCLAVRRKIWPFETAGELSV